MAILPCTVCICVYVCVCMYARLHMCIHACYHNVIHMLLEESTLIYYVYIVVLRLIKFIFMSTEYLVNYYILYHNINIIILCLI